MQQCSLGADQLGGSFAEKDLAVIVGNKLTAVGSRPLQQWWPTAYWAVTATVKQLLPSILHLRDPIWSTVSSFGLPSSRKTLTS